MLTFIEFLEEKRKHNKKDLTIKPVKKVKRAKRIYNVLAHYSWRHKNKHKKVHEAVLKELEVRDASGKKHHLNKVAIRMADGKIKMQDPGKSGSSGGGGNGS
jgi:hypothetical protein